MQRVKKRSFQKFGNRMLPGGDLHEQEEKFFEFVTSRPESTVEEWIQLLSCSILRIDGTKPVEENVDFIINQMIISKNPQFTGISARQQLEFTTHLLLTD